jgi:hypothetical protein
LFSNVNNYEMKMPKRYVELSEDEMEYDGGASIWANIIYSAVGGAITCGIAGTAVPGVGTVAGAIMGAAGGAIMGAVDYYGVEALQAIGEAGYNYAVDVYNNIKSGDT